MVKSMPEEGKAKKVVQERRPGSAGRGCHFKQSGQKRPPEGRVFEQVPTNTHRRGRRGLRDIWVRSILGKDSHALREEAARLVGEL